MKIFNMKAICFFLLLITCSLSTMLKVSELKCLNFTSNILETITNSNSNEKILEILNNKFALSKLKAYILIMSKSKNLFKYKIV